MRIEGEDGSRHLNRGAPVGARPTAPLVPTRQPLHFFKRTSLAGPLPSSRTQDNALYSLITLSNWRALRSRALGIIKTNQHESFFSFPSAAAPTGGQEQGGETVFGGGFERKKGE